MSSPIRSLGIAELWSALDRIDAVETVSQDLVGRAAGRAPRELRPLRADADLVVFECLDHGSRYLLPAGGLRAARSSTLIAVAARQLLAPGLVTMAVLDAGPDAYRRLLRISGLVPDVSHISVYGPIRPGDPSYLPRMVHRLDLAGIGLTVAATADEAVFGASLVVVGPHGRPQECTGGPAMGTVLVNATGRRLPTTLVDGAAVRYVDDRALLGPDWMPRRADRRAGGAGRPRPEADLGHVVSGAARGRTDPDHVLLVDLLSLEVLDIRLARQICDAADGLGAVDR